MGSSTHTLEIRPDLEQDPAYRGLERLLAAEADHAHATARRSFLAHVCAALGVPLWLFAAGIGPHAIREGGLLLFPPFLVTFVIAVFAERASLRRLRAAEHGIDFHRRPL